MNFNYVNMSLGPLFTKFHHIAMPEFPLHMQTQYLCMNSLLFYVSQNVCKKSEVFLERSKLATEKDRISAKFGFKIA
jgi:hypothetical protein